MDIQQNIQNNVDDIRESESRSKIILELSERKYNLQKKLRDDSMKLSEKKSKLEELRKEVVKLKYECITWEEKEKVASKVVEDLAKQVALQEKAAENAQAIFWKKINDFIAKSVQHLKKHQPAVKNQAKSKDDIEKERKEKLRQCGLRGRLEALKAFEQYQKRKIDELMMLKNMLR